MKVLKIIIILVVSLTLIFYPFYQAKAIPTADPFLATLLGFLVTKEYGLDPAARVIARGILKTMIDKVINKISTSGRDGSAGFVRDWRNFQLGGQYRGEDLWRGLLYIAANGDPSRNIPPLLCDHIRQSTVFNALQPTEINNLIGSGVQRRVDALDEYLIATTCDPVVNQNYQLFQEDFSQGGGWDMWGRMLQPQHNIYGAINLALDELTRQRSLEEKVDIDEAKSASGFVSKRAGCLSRGISGECVIWEQIVTPGDILGKSVVESINQSLAWVSGADEIEEVIFAIIGSILDRIFSDEGLVTGTAVGPGYPAPPQDIPPIPTPPPPPEPPNCILVFDPDTGNYEIVCNGGGGGGGDVCADQGGTADYAGDLRISMDVVIADNPDGIADLPYTPDNGRTFLSLVAQDLSAGGFSATTNVLNGNDNLNPSGDLIAVWQPSDSTVERYDALIADQGAIRDSTWTNFTGDIPFSCLP